jgi:peptide deformylase
LLSNGKEAKYLSYEGSLSLQIRIWDDLVLSQVGTRISDSEFGPELVSFGEQMLQTMYEANGLGLAAHQVGLPKCLFVMRLISTGEETNLVVCNPELVFSGKTVYEREGCLSLPSIYEQVGRAETAVMRYQDALGKRYETLLEGFDARIAAHEADHLSGIMFFNRMSKQMKKSVLKAWSKVNRIG